MNHDSHVGPIAELILHEHSLKNVQRLVLRLVRFHVDMHVGIVLSSDAEQSSQSRSHPLGCPVAVGQIELTVERRELDRHVDPRQRAALVAVDAAYFGPGVDSRSNPFNQIDVCLQVAFGFNFANHRLAEDVERKGPLLRSLSLGSVEHLGRIRAGDEPPGVGRGRFSGHDRKGAARRGQRSGNLESHARRRWKPRLDRT